jgi:hypothetical protein
MAVEYMEEKGIENINGISFDMNKLIFLMQNTLERINNLDEDSEEYNDMQLVKLDFLRRLRLFDDAKILIDIIKNDENIYQGIAVDIITYQINLIERNDINEHYLGELEK